MTDGSLWSRASRCLVLNLLLAQTIWMPVPAGAESEGVASGSLTVSITSPAVLPPGFALNPGGTTPSSSSFADSGNAGNGSFSGLGSAGCTPVGCTNPQPGVNLQYQLSTDLTCTAQLDGTYGGLEDSFALLGARNQTGQSVSLDLRFTSSWSVSATADAGPYNAAEASIDILWAVPTSFCIALTSCPSGSLSGGSTVGCPSGYTKSPTLILGSSEVDTSMGNEANAGPASNCDATVVVLINASSGGDLNVTSSCRAMGCPVLMLDNDTVAGPLTQEACEIQVGPNYGIVGPSGNLTLRANKQVQIGGEFSVGDGAGLIIEMDPDLIP